MRPLCVLLAFGLTGCGDCGPFSAIEVMGGSSPARQVVGDAVRDFAAWTGRDEVCAERIEIVDELEHRDPTMRTLGLYFPRRGLIRVVERQRGLRDTVIHELCHAMDHGEDLTQRYPGVFSLDTERFGFDRGSDWADAGEGLALDCELGPDALALGLEAVDRCHPRVDDAPLRVLLHDLYGAAEPQVGEVHVERTPGVTVPLEEGWRLPPFQPVTTSDAGELLLIVFEGDHTRLVAIDPFSGAFLGEPVGRLVLPEALPSVPRRLGASGGAPFGDGVITTIRWRLASGPLLSFLAVRDDEGWDLPDDPCVQAASWVVPVEGRNWLVELEDGALSLTLLSAPPTVVRR